MQISESTTTSSANYIQAQNASDINQDSRLKAIQKQIENVQKQLKELSQDSTTFSEEKADMQEELRMQLRELNRQLMEKRTEIQQEKLEKAIQKKADREQNNFNRQDFSNISMATVQSMLKASASQENAETIAAIKAGMENDADVLKSQIETDWDGGSTEHKETTLSALEARVDDVTGGMMSEIGDVLKEAGKGDRTMAVEEDEKSGNETQTQQASNADDSEDVQTTAPDNVFRFWLFETLTQHIDAKA